MLRRVVKWLDELTIQRLGLIVAVGLLVATWYQARLTRDTLHDSERAFVYAKDPFLIGDGEKPGTTLTKPAFLVVNLPNSGETLARHATININYCLTMGGLPEAFAFSPSPKNQSPILIAPKTESQSSFELPAAVLADIEADKRTLFVYGQVSYQDIFDIWHKTEFCTQYRGFVLNDDGSIEKLIFSACPEHNCQDNDCPDKWGDALCP
jgi:hypothetical protein